MLFCISKIILNFKDNLGFCKPIKCQKQERDRKGSTHKITLNLSFQIDWLIKEILSYHYDWDCQIMSKYYHAYYCFIRLIHHLIWNCQKRVIFTMKMTKTKTFPKVFKVIVKNIHQKHLSKKFIQKRLVQLVKKVFKYTKNHWKETKGNKIIHKKSTQQRFFTKQTKKHLDI